MMNVYAVVVTYNRLELLKQCVQSLLKQTIRISNIVIVNNSSTDGTTEWLKTQNELTIINQANTGGAGGFFTGSKYAYDNGADWIWMMDDDVVPETDCLENLLKANTPQRGIIQPIRIYKNQHVLLESKLLNLTNPFKGLHQSKVELKDIQNICNVQAIPFEGPLIKRSVFERIGFPNPNYFILYDDTDFSYRTIASGYQIVLTPQAILRKLVMRNTDFDASGWKHKYEIRNAAYFDRVYGKNCFVRYCRPLMRVIHLLLFCIYRKKKFTIKNLRDTIRYTLLGINKNMNIID